MKSVEVSILLNTSERAIRQRISRGQLPFRRNGRSIWFIENELEEFIRRLLGTTVEQALQEVEK